MSLFCHLWHIPELLAGIIFLSWVSHLQCICVVNRRGIVLESPFLPLVESRRRWCLSHWIHLSCSPREEIIYMLVFSPAGTSSECQDPSKSTLPNLWNKNLKTREPVLTHKESPVQGYALNYQDNTAYSCSDSCCWCSHNYIKWVRYSCKVSYVW